MPGWLSTVLDLAGAALVVVGISLWSIPAALVAAGAVLLAMSWRANA